MTPEQRRSVKVMVKGKTQLSYVQSANVVRLMEVKNDIDNSRFQSALYGLLEFVLRQADLGPVYTLDDLTKLLNTGGETFDTARILIDGGLEEDEV
ncbi:hypothetical protein Maynard_91 [Salmonella phage Maynard]|uniref:Uncharacterized protein n=2 Tax=Kuttervirus TaxID=2169536 RepID=U5PZ34_9CAUD|nr:hypothetical protein Maynard_91 [Salmonella phage Maynard]YP_008771709.1 hypothetical protein Marshall_91 [Salmonella phage Marshall]AGY47608.1 hypothetical protein Marshall_91 [Salmonella phage Marshall]AGY47813.1 hypothetical protein Maynard_91 [Salmonella phage Maynard]